jgi:hypothetical protein
VEFKTLFCASWKQRNFCGAEVSMFFKVDKLGVGQVDFHDAEGVTAQ